MACNGRATARSRQVLKLTKMKSLMYEDWYRIEIPAAARGAESSCTLAPELSVKGCGQYTILGSRVNTARTNALRVRVNLEDFPPFRGDFDGLPVGICPSGSSRRMTAV